MSAEILLQFDLFSGELVDNRSDYQKRLDKERDKPRQQQLFPVTEIGQFQQNVRPWLNDLPSPTLTLEIQDVRTEEEREQQLMKAAEELTEPLFHEETTPEAAANIGENPLVGSEPTAIRIPLFHLSKAELLTTRPDMQPEIEQLGDTDIEAIALQAQEALRAIYTMVLNVTLADYLTRARISASRAK